MATAPAPAVVPQADAYAAFRATAYFPSLNGIRAICALMVLKEHAHW